MDDNVLKQIEKLNKMVSKNNALISGAYARIEVNQRAVQALENEVEQLRSFLKVVEADHQNFKSVISKKIKYVNQIEQVEKMHFKKTYVSDMNNTLNVITRKCVDVQFGFCEDAIRLKIQENQAKIVSLDSIIATDQLSIGNLNEAIKEFKKTIRSLKGD